MKNKQTIDIAAFGAVRPMKNHLIQAIAAIKFANEIGKKLKFHINVTRVENNGDPVLKNIRSLFLNSPHELVEHVWLTHEEFVNLSSTMDMCLQVSLSETFNIVTADAVNSNVPIVVSDEIKWASSLFKALPTDSCSIVSKMKFTWIAKCFGLQFINKLFLAWYSLKSEGVWLDYFKYDCCDCECDCQDNCICSCSCD